MAENKCWQVYIIEASDGKLYTGITNNMEERWQAHASGKGAKFFRGRRPKAIRFCEKHSDRSAASIREAEIKKLSRQKKLELIEQINRNCNSNTRDQDHPD